LFNTGHKNSVENNLSELSGFHAYPYPTSRSTPMHGASLTFFLIRKPEKGYYLWKMIVQE